ncbi:hypothetical protein FACS189490_14170 [Clostridia bacterium]|nr:hypothetical protein FACS189490_14170 [Clostridia bacterium]
MNGVKEDLINALNKKYGINDVCELSGMDLQHYTFAATSNERGEKAVESFLKYGFDLNSMRILDIGCAYGGFAIAAAKCGASVYGVDIDDELTALSEQNLLGIDNIDCKIILSDATSVGFCRKIPVNYFDLIIVNDVFEHVYDTTALLSNISRASNADAVIYFAIPSGTNIPYAFYEPHSGYLGLSILPPHLWSLSGSRPRSIYYRPWDYYSAIFRHYGFTQINFLTFPNDEDENIRSVIQTKFEEYKTKFNVDIEKQSAEFRRYMLPALVEYESRMIFDLYDYPINS